MPNSKAAAKALRQDARKKDRNDKVKTELRYLVKHTRRAVTNKAKDQAQDFLKKALKAYDKAVQNKVIKPNTGSRMKSRLSKLVKTIA
ncbi:MAG: 30S ribosomal protein S20 [Candidatus Nomurabacteria bacterium]|nr:MAG: 30S ribosomal protein S20 [Candidatus Nomurabacteria bacterium]